jgi:[acyl-carrier-protein] S-malonyltransferase
MLTPWLEVDGTRERLAAWSELAELDLVELGTVADADAIKDTSVTQPLVVAASLLAYEVLADRFTLPDDIVVAGHSVGELTAAAIAGVLTPDDAVALAAVRGREMAAACEFATTGMAAVMGGEPDDVVAWLAGHGLTAANMNGAGQIVAAGPVDGIDAVVAEKPDFVKKVIRLKVAGAFHTSYMAPAQEALRAKAKDITVSDATRTLLSNADGTRVGDGAEVLERLVEQVTLPVRWDLCMAAMRELGVHAAVELPPAGALTGLVKRELAGTTTAALKIPDNLAKVAAALQTSDEE